MKKKTNKNFYLRLESLSSEVTGSCNYCELHLPNKKVIKFLVDCGTFLDKDSYELNKTFSFDASEIDFAIATHHHIDHVGRFAMLYNQGYTGKIYTSAYTAEYMKKTAISNFYRQSKEFGNSLWSENDAITLIQNIVTLKNNVKLEINENIDIIFFKNAHCQGAIMCMLTCKYMNEGNINVLCTGDYKDKTIVRNSWISEEYKKLPVTIVTEATYGIESKPKENFDRLVIKSVNERKSILISAIGESIFEITLARIKELKKMGKIELDMPIYVDINRKLEIDTKTLMAMPSNVTFIKKVQEKANAIYDNRRKIILVTERGGLEYFLSFMLANEGNMILFTNHIHSKSKLFKVLNSDKGEYVVFNDRKVKKMAKVCSTEEFGCHAYVQEIEEKLVDFFENVNGILFGHGDKYAKREVASHFSEKKSIQCFVLKRNRAFRISNMGIKYE